MKNFFSLLFAASMLCGGFTLAQGQSSTIQANALDIHITSNTTRMELAQLQKDMSEVGIGFRYDLINWVEGELKSIRFAVRLPDGSMRRNVYESMDADSDIWIRLEGEGNERIFCAGNQCDE